MAPPAPRRRPVDGLSIAALVTALLGLSVVAIILGHFGRKNTRGRLDLGGYGMASAGFYIGIFTLVVEAFILIGWLVFLAVQAG